MNVSIENILRRLLAGELTVDTATDTLASAHSAYIDVAGIAKLDLDREHRTGIPESIYCEGKNADQIIAIARAFIGSGRRNIIGSRATAEVACAVINAIPDTEYFPASRTLLFAPMRHEHPIGNIGIVTAGTADLPLAEEIQIVAQSLGSAVTLVADAGVASIQRLLANLDSLRAMHVIVVVAGMEGALPSVVAGLVTATIIAVPSSIGYGVNTHGINALCSALGSCVPGVLTVNVDNGFGAACAAHKINAAIAGTR